MLYLREGCRNQNHHPKTAPVVYLKKPERQLLKRPKRSVRQHPLQIRIPDIPYIHQALSLLDPSAQIKIPRTGSRQRQPPQRMRTDDWQIQHRPYNIC